MKVHFKSMLLIALLLLVGCANKDIADYDDDDVAAIVRGEEITVIDLRILYTDEKVLDMMDGTIKAKLVEQEAKKMNLDVAAEIEQEIETKTNDILDETDDSSWESTRDFAEIQAGKLGMTQEQFLERYIELTTVQNTYMNAYVEALVDKSGDGVEDIQGYNEKANALLDDLVARNKEEIKKVIQ